MPLDLFSGLNNVDSAMNVVGGVGDIGNLVGVNIGGEGLMSIKSIGDSRVGCFGGVGQLSFSPIPILSIFALTGYGNSGSHNIVIGGGIECLPIMLGPDIKLGVRVSAQTYNKNYFGEIRGVFEYSSLVKITFGIFVMPYSSAEAIVGKTNQVNNTSTSNTSTNKKNVPKSIQSLESEYQAKEKAYFDQKKVVDDFRDSRIAAFNLELSDLQPKVDEGEKLNKEFQDAMSRYKSECAKKGIAWDQGAKDAAKATPEISRIHNHPSYIGLKNNRDRLTTIKNNLSLDWLGYPTYGTEYLNKLNDTHKAMIEAKAALDKAGTQTSDDNTQSDVDTQNNTVQTTTNTTNKSSNKSNNPSFCFGVCFSTSVNIIPVIKKFQLAKA